MNCSMQVQCQCDNQQYDALAESKSVVWFTGYNCARCSIFTYRAAVVGTASWLLLCLSPEINRTEFLLPVLPFVKKINRFSSNDATEATGTVGPLIELLQQQLHSS